MLRANGSREGYEAYHTVDSFDWESLGESTVVDVCLLLGAIEHELTNNR